MFPIFYINLSSRPDRRSFMEAQLSALGLDAIRVEAVTESEISDQDAAIYCNPDMPSFIRRRQLACTLSHEKAWAAMLMAGHEQALILEDDAELSTLVPAFLAEAHTIDADLIRIEKSKRIRVYPPVLTGSSGVGIRKFRSTPMGSAGYILTATAARRLLGHASLRATPIDLALYNPFDEPGCSLSRVITEPALCRQLGVVEPQTASVGRSDIAHDHVKHRYAEKRRLSHMWSRLRRKFRHGIRNIADHVVERRKGLTRASILFRT